MHRRWTSTALAVLAVAAPPLVVVVLPVAVLVGRNLGYFPDGYRTGVPLYLAALAVLAAGAALTLWWRGAVVRWLAALYLLSAPAWFLHSLALDVTGSLALSGVLLLAWIGAAVGAARVPRETLLASAGVLAIGLLLAGGVPLATAQEPDEPGGGDRPEIAGPAGEPTDLPNIYHLVFDEYQTDFFTHLLDDDLREALGGFVFYPETVTTYGRTEMAFVSMFSRQDYDYSISPDDAANEALRGDLSTLGALGDLGYHRVGYLHNPRYVGGDVHLDEYVRHDDLEEFSGLAGRTDLLASLWVYAHTPERVSRRLIPEHHYEQLAAEALLPDDAPPRSVAGFRRLMDEEPALPGRGRYTLAHFILPHFPHVLDERCLWWPGERTDPARQSACANRLVVEFVDLLRDLDRFEDSIVIVQADHGAWHEVAGDGLVSIERDGHYDEVASFARARSLLLVHAPGLVESETPLRVDDRPSTLDDVMPTVFDALGVDHPFSGNRYSLLADPEPDRERFYHFYDRAEGHHIVDGAVVRYRVEPGGLVRDREIPVPHWE